MIRIKKIIFYILILLLIPSIGYSGYTFTSQSPFKKKDIDTWITRDSTWEFGDATDRISKMYVDDMDILDLLIGGTATGTLDMNGNSIILDVDGNTSVTADTDNQIDWEIGGIDDIQFTFGTYLFGDGVTGVKKIILDAGTDSRIVYSEGGMPYWSAGHDRSPSSLYYIGTGDSPSSKKITIKQSGEVGIGTDTPNGTLEVNGTIVYTPSSIQNVTAAGGITVTHRVTRVQGSDGPVDITSDPQIGAGTADGEEACIVGQSDTNTVKLENGAGLLFPASPQDNVTLGLHDSICFEWVLSANVWIMSRSPINISP